jgi:type IV secretory pathway VirB3-like protein
VVQRCGGAEVISGYLHDITNSGYQLRPTSPPLYKACNRPFQIPEVTLPFYFFNPFFFSFLFFIFAFLFLFLILLLLLISFLLFPFYLSFYQKTYLIHLGQNCSFKTFPYGVDGMNFI